MSEDTMDQDIWRRLLNLEHCGPVSVNDLRAIRAAVAEIERLRFELAESARNVISQMAVEDELRSLITGWADACDADNDMWKTDPSIGDRAVTFSAMRNATLELRKAVGR